MSATRWQLPDDLVDEVEQVQAALVDVEFLVVEGHVGGIDATARKLRIDVDLGL